MKRILLAICSAALLFGACQKYDDTSLKGRMSDLEAKMTELLISVQNLSSSVSAMQAIVDAAQKNVTIRVVTQTADGYTVSFSDGTTVELKNGAKGDTGKTPVVSLKEEDGIFYWTVDGEWLLDADGNKVPSAAAPKFKVEEGAWYYSYDGETWEWLAKVEDLGSNIKVTEDSMYYYFKLSDTETIKIAKSNGFRVSVDATEVSFAADGTASIAYTLSGADETTKVFATSNEFTVAVNEAAATVNVTAGATRSGIVVIYAIRNSDNAMSGAYVTFRAGSVELVSSAQVGSIPVGGGEVTVEISRLEGVSYEVIIPEAAQGWITFTGTKAVNETLSFSVQPNDTGEARSANVEIKPTDGSASIFVTFSQKGATGENEANVYRKASTVEDGVYLIVADGKAGIAIAENKNYGYLNASDVTEDEDGKVVLKPRNEEFTITAVEGGYTIQQSDGRYLYMTGTYNSFNLSDTAGDGSVWTISIAEDGRATITNVAMGKYIQYSTKYSSYGCYSEAQDGGALPILYFKTGETVELEDPDNPDNPDIPAGAFDTTVEVTLGGERSYQESAVINGVDATVYKLGTSSKTGELSFPVPAGSKSLSFYAIGWYNADTSVEVYEGASMIDSFPLTNNPGATGNEPYDITCSDSDHFTVEKDFSSDTVVTLASDKRVIIWGIQVK